jgi:hypothetical protein
VLEPKCPTCRQRGIESMPCKKSRTILLADHQASVAFINLLDLGATAVLGLTDQV